MLPFRKKRNPGEEMELDDDDLVLVEEPRVHVHARVAPAASAAPAAPATRARKNNAPPGSRRVVEERVEQDVAGQCLASIAAETSRILPYVPSSSSHIRAVAVRPPPMDEHEHIDVDCSELELIEPASLPPARLPSVSAPPFVRTMLVPRDAAPAPSAFVRKSTPGIAVAPVPTSSVAPVSMTAPPAANSASASTKNEPTVIVLRERPKAIWILAAAAIGAMGAIAGTRLSSVESSTTPAAAVAEPVVTAPATLPPSTAVVAPPASAASVVTPAPAVPVASGKAPSSATAAVVNFGDSQGVAFQAPQAPRRFVAPLAAPASPAAPSKVAVGSAPRGSARQLGPALPDGSFSLGPPPSLTAAMAAPAAPPPPAPPGPEAPKKRALTPEQQLAEAQLKASMK